MITQIVGGKVTMDFKGIPDEYQIQDIQNMVVELNEKADENEVSNLMDAMKNSRKIDAIKAYRALTGTDLRTSKDAVERHYVSRPNELKDILNG